jgi:hypothetical protein
MQRSYLRAKHLARVYEVRLNRPWYMRIGKEVAICLNRREVVFPLFVAHIDDAIFGKKHAVAGITGRHYAVEHINPQRDIFQNIHRCTHAHQVSGLALGEDIAHNFGHGVHLFGRFANR